MNYVIVGGELYHHGVKGMKWGVRRSLKGKYKRLGRIQGKKDYYEEQSRLISDSYSKKANEYRSKAKMYESEGSTVKAAKLNAKADRVQNQGKIAASPFDREVRKYEAKERVMKAKISSYEVKKSASIGKERVDYILSKSRNKAYNNEKYLNAGLDAANMYLNMKSYD
jgi:hypothetical protein